MVRHEKLRILLLSMIATEHYTVGINGLKLQPHERVFSLSFQLLFCTECTAIHP